MTLPLFVVLTMGIVQRGNTFLIAQRSLTDDQAPGVWSFPGGKLEHTLGEFVLEENLKKELQEEVGVQIQDNPLFLANDIFIRSSGHHVLTLLFLCKWKSGKGEPLEDQAAVKWATITELDNMELHSYSKRRVLLLVRHLSLSKE